MRDIRKYEEEYLNSDFEEHQVSQRRKRVLESIYGHRRLLEIGCGMAPLFEYIDWEYDYFMVIEPGQIFADNAKNKAKKYGGKIDIVNELFVSSQELVDKKFDAVICSGLLHEVQNPKEILRDIAVISNDDTIIHINVPNANSFHRLLAKEMGLISDVKQFSERNKSLQQNAVFDLQELEKVCVNEGFSVKNRGSYFVKPFTHDQMKKMLDNGIIDEIALNGLYNMSRYLPDLGSEIFVDCEIRRGK